MAYKHLAWFSVKLQNMEFHLLIPALNPIIYDCARTYLIRRNSNLEQVTNGQSMTSLVEGLGKKSAFSSLFVYFTF